MPDLLADSCANLTMIDQPSCGNDYGRPYMIALMHHDGAITRVGTVPTVTEMETAIALGSTDSVNQMIVVRVGGGTTMGESGAEETPAEQTLTGIPRMYSQIIDIPGNFVEVNEALRRKLEILGQNTTVRAWVITTTGWLFGEGGYLCTCDIKGIELTTTGGFHPFSFKRTKYRGETDTAAQDNTTGTALTGYKGLTNYSA